MSYLIADEPHDSSWKNLVVHPNAPLLAQILCGSWLALPWFVFNSYAIGSPSRRKEIMLCATQLAGTLVLGALLLWARGNGVIESRTLFQLGLLAITGWKLAVGYAITRTQSVPFQVHEQAGGASRSPTLVIMSGLVLNDFVLGLFDHPIWEIIIAGMS